LSTLGGALRITQASARAIPAAPIVAPGEKNLVVLTGAFSGSATVPAGYHHVVDNTTGNATVSGTDITLIGNDDGGTYFVAGNSTIAAVGGRNYLSGIGNVLMSAGEGSDTLLGLGTGTMHGGGGTNTLVGSGAIHMSAQGTNDVIFAAAGDNTVSSSGHGAAIFGGSGSIKAGISGDNTTVAAGGAHLFASLHGSNAVVFGGAGTTNISVYGRGGTLVGGSGSGTINAGSSGALIFGSSGVLNVYSGSGTSTFVGGAGAATVSATDSAMVFGGAGMMNLQGGSGVLTVIGGVGGQEQVTVGAGGLAQLEAEGGVATIFSGAGEAHLYGASNSYINFVGSDKGAIWVGGSGNETINASWSSTNNTLFGSQSDRNSGARMIGGSGNDQFVAGQGTATMTGGGGSDLFTFFDILTVGKASVITDFQAVDVINILGYGQTADQLLDTATFTAGSGLTVTLSDHTTITFSSLTNASQLAGRVGSDI